MRVSEVPRIMKHDIDLLQCFDETFEYLPLLIRGSKGSGKDHIKERYSLISRAVFSRIQRYHNTAVYRFSGGNAVKPAFLNIKKTVNCQGSSEDDIRRPEACRLSGGHH